MSTASVATGRKTLDILLKNAAGQHQCIVGTDLVLFHDGFAFTVQSEIDAYKAAHAYRHSKNTSISAVNGIYRVQVYR